MMLASYTKLKDISWAWGRIFSVYGPNEDAKRLCSSVILALLSKKPVECANGSLTRDYLHASDVASAFNKLLVSDVSGVYNIGSGQPLTLKDLVRNIESQIGNMGILKVSQPATQDDASIIVANVDRLLRTGWTPVFNLDDGLRDTIEWFEENRG